MEVVQGTEADRKGGHIARRRSDGQLVLRETAQTPPEDEDSFRDYRRWRYYNTNSLWVDLARAGGHARPLRGGVLELPVIVNRKTVDPRDSSSTPVIQLESAMGAAIGSFTGAQLLLRAAHAVRAGQDDRRSARAALRRLHALATRLVVAPVPERAGDLPYVELDSTLLQAARRLRAAISRRRPVAARRRPARRAR